jgi:hypothetical protein
VLLPIATFGDESPAAGYERRSAFASKTKCKRYFWGASVEKREETVPCGDRINENYLLREPLKNRKQFKSK